MEPTPLLSSIERSERNRILKKARLISPPSAKALVLHGALAGPCLMSVFFFVPFLGQCLALLTVALMVRLFWVCRSVMPPLWWSLGALVTLFLVGSALSWNRTGFEFWLYVLFGVSMAGALGSLLGAGGFLSDQFERARQACEAERVD